MNLMGGSFCPGAEVNWIIAIGDLSGAVRLKADAAFEFPADGRKCQSEQQSFDRCRRAIRLLRGDDLSRATIFAAACSRAISPSTCRAVAVRLQRCTTQPIDITYELWTPSIITANTIR